MKIYLLRHGETDSNLNCIFDTHTDVPLNETGIKQSYEIIKEIENLEFECIYSSPAQRATKTAEIVNTRNHPIIIDKCLKERSAGCLEGKTYEEFSLDEFFNYNLNIEYENAENMQEFCNRVWAFLEELKSKYEKDDKKVLIITHNIVIRAIRAYVFGIPEDGNLRYLRQDNCELAELEI